MFLFYSIPVTARPTYFHQLRAMVFHGVKFGITTVLLVIAVQSLDAGETHLAAIASAHGLGMIASLFVARYARTSAIIRSIVIPQILSNVCFLGVAFVSSIGPFAVLVGLAVFFEALVLPAMTGVESANYPATHRGTIVGFIRSRMIFLGILTSTIVAEILSADPHAYRYLIPAGALFGLLSTWRIARIRVRGAPHVPEDAGADEPADTPCSVLDVLRDRRYAAYQAGFFFVGSGNLMFLPMLPKFLKDGGVGYELSTAAIAVIPGLVMVFTVGWWGRVLDRWNPLSLRSLTNGLWCLEPALLFVAAWIDPALGALGIGLILTARVIRGFILGGNWLVWGLGANYFARREDVPAYMSVHAALTGLRVLIAPMIGALIVRQAGGYQALFVVSGALMFVGMLLVMALTRAEKRAGRLGTFAEREAARRLV